MPPEPKPASTERVRKLTDDALNRLAEELKAGRSDTLKAYLAAMARFHRYSWTNTILIQSQRPTATRVAGYHTWRDLGRWVKRGEKGIAIYAPIVTKVREPEASPRPSDTSNERRVTGFRAAYVFDVEQTEGKAMPAFSQTAGDPKQHLDNLKEIVATRHIALNYDLSIAPAQGQSLGGSIRILPNLSPAEEFVTLAHELAHELLHHQPGAGAIPPTVRETQAEAFAFVLSQAIGLENQRSASDYIALYNGDPNTLAESLTAIHRAATQILNDLVPDTSERTETVRRLDRDISNDFAPEVSQQLGPDAHFPEPRDAGSLER